MVKKQPVYTSAFTPVWHLICGWIQGFYQEFGVCLDQIYLIYLAAESWRASNHLFAFFKIMFQ